MKPVLQRRTTQAALAKVEKRLDKLEQKSAEIEFEQEALQQARAFLQTQLSEPSAYKQLPLIPAEAPVPQAQGTAELPQGVSSEAEEHGVARCFWVTEPHQHLINGDQETCLAEPGPGNRKTVNKGRSTL